jgi:hypothetical protein
VRPTCKKCGDKIKRKQTREMVTTSSKRLGVGKAICASCGRERWELGVVSVRGLRPSAGSCQWGKTAFVLRHKGAVTIEGKRQRERRRRRMGRQCDTTRKNVPDMRDIGVGRPSSRAYRQRKRSMAFHECASSRHHII